jgi:hypothetical protein
LQFIQCSPHPAAHMELADLVFQVQLLCHGFCISPDHPLRGRLLPFSVPMVPASAAPLLRVRNEDLGVFRPAIVLKKKGE